MKFPFSDAYNFQPYPNPWQNNEWNRHVDGCMVAGRDKYFCRPVAQGDCLNFQFKASDKGDNIRQLYHAGTHATTGVTANKIVKTGFNFAAYQVGDLVLNVSDNTGTTLQAPLNVGDAKCWPDIFTASPKTFKICRQRSLIAPNWLPKLDTNGDLLIYKISDSVNDSQVRIVDNSLVTAGTPYRIKFTVTNYAGGSAFVQFGTLIVGYIYGNGTYEFYGEMTGSGGITISSFVANNFIGTINMTTLEFYELETQYYLCSLADVPEVLDELPDSFSLNSETGIVTYTNCDVYEGYPVGSCFYLGLYDSCKFGNLIPCENVWTLGPNTEYDGDACQLILSGSKTNGELIANYLPDCVGLKIEYNISFTISELTGSIIAGFGGIGGNLGSFTTNGTYTFNNIEIESPISDGLQFYAVGVGISVTISDISITEANPLPNYVSECITISDSCSIELKYRNNSNVFGFDYSDEAYYNYIRICGRLRYAAMRTNDYKFLKSTLGYQRSTFADLSKVKELIINVIPPYLIRAIQTALVHSDVWITDEAGEVRYCLTENPDAEFTDQTELGKIQVQLAEFNEENSWQN